MMTTPTSNLHAQTHTNMRAYSLNSKGKRVTKYGNLDLKWMNAAEVNLLQDLLTTDQWMEQ